VPGLLANGSLIVVAGCAPRDDAGVIETGYSETGGRLVAELARLRCLNVVRRLADGHLAIVTYSAWRLRLAMIHPDRRVRDGRVAGLAGVAGLRVGQRLAGRPGAVMAGGATGRRLGMVELDRRHAGPILGRMAGLARARSRHVQLVFSAGVAAVMAGYAGLYHLLVVDVRRLPALGAVTIRAIVTRWNVPGRLARRLCPTRPQAIVAVDASRRKSFENSALVASLAEHPAVRAGQREASRCVIEILVDGGDTAAGLRLRRRDRTSHTEEKSKDQPHGGHRQSTHSADASLIRIKSADEAAPHLFPRIASQKSGTPMPSTFAPAIPQTLTSTIQPPPPRRFQVLQRRM
jgi:hypothetical protein